MERPALQRLLRDVEAGRIDIVVVYKVDRLTRSLADFARIVDVFDRNGVSFVSVTQSFNTTSSMGRLTLNVLLSFAQFEREITAERIRDKIAASKKRGLWMGGNVPLGYDAVDRRLVVNEAEARTVRRVFELYLEHGCVGLVEQHAASEGLRSKRRPQGASRKARQLRDRARRAGEGTRVAGTRARERGRHRNNGSDGTRRSLGERCRLQAPDKAALLRKAADRERRWGLDGGETGIRTLETVARLHAFQACAFDHSATSPAMGELTERRRAFKRAMRPDKSQGDEHRQQSKDLGDARIGGVGVSVHLRARIIRTYRALRFHASSLMLQPR